MPKEQLGKPGHPSGDQKTANGKLHNYRHIVIRGKRGRHISPLFPSKMSLDMLGPKQVHINKELHTYSTSTKLHRQMFFWIHLSCHGDERYSTARTANSSEMLFHDCLQQLSLGHNSRDLDASDSKMVPQGADLSSTCIPAICSVV